MVDWRADGTEPGEIGTYGTVEGKDLTRNRENECLDKATVGQKECRGSTGSGAHWKLKRDKFFALDG